MAKWPYNTAAWRNLRAEKLKGSPMCEPCERRGRLVPANTVDHVLAIAKGGDPFPPLSGLMSCCTSCHNSKTGAVDRKGGNGVALKGYGPDGLPIDPQHPCYATGGHTPSKDEALRGADRLGSRVFTKFDRGF
jgi:hypothetical protein